MNADELCWAPATALARMVRTKDVSPVEIIDAYLERIERINPRINAYCTVVAEQARKAAAEAEAAKTPTVQVEFVQKLASRCAD